jgi:hypothetical protein
MKKILLFSILMYSGECYSQHYIDNYLTGTPTYTTIASATNAVAQPRDLDFKPFTNELWVANKGDADGSPVVIIYNAGEAGQRVEFRHDSHAGHFMAYASGIAFGDNGNWGSTGEIKNTLTPSSTFMGPALWSSDTSVFARVFQNNWVNGLPLGSHLDMLHQSPFSMGIAHDSGNIYWVFDGYNGNLCKYDFGADHASGYDDHSNGKVWRYTDVPLTRVTDVPGHMVLDKASGWLYIVDAGAKKLKRVNTRSGSITGSLSVPASGAEALAGYWAVTGAQVEELDSFLTSQPCGIDLYDGRMIVSDYSTGIITVYNISGATPAKMGTIATGQAGIMGVKIGTDGRIWFVNHSLNTVVRIDHANTPNNDAAIDRITAPAVNNWEAGYYNTGFNQCANSVTPVVVLRNSGANALSSATISYRIDNGTPATFSWTGSLAANATASVTLPAISTPEGDHKLIVWTSNPNGSADSNPANDRKEGAFRTRSTVVNFPFSENFSATTFPPAGWFYIGNNFNAEMSHDPTVGGFGSNDGSIMMDNYSSSVDITGQKDYLILPRIDMSAATSSVGLGFSVAYAQYNLSSDDALSVMASTDCGQTWTELYSKSGSALATATPSLVEFAPAATDWRSEIVSLAAYAGQSDLMLMFVTTSNYGNNLYLDDINIASGLGLEELNAARVSIYPNPTTGKVSVAFAKAEQAGIEVLDVAGRQVTNLNMTSPAGKLELDLSDQPNGIYMIRVSTGGQHYQQKISVLK